MHPITEQPEYNLFHRERVEQEYQSLYKKYGMGTTIWGPLSFGILSGKYNNGTPDGSRFAIAWCLKNPNVSSVIIGASKMEQLQENLKALDILPVFNEEIINEAESVLRS